MLNVLVPLVALIFSLFATTTLSYIAMVASIGPWIETTLVLFAMFIFYALVRKISQPYINAVGLSTAAGGIGGILATAVAFSIPTIFFVAPQTFQSWLNNPWLFCLVLAAFSFCAGGFGLVIADLFEEQLVVKEKLKFPIGELIYNTMIAPGQFNKAVELVVGFFGTQAMLYLNRFYKLFGDSLLLSKKFTWLIFSTPQLNLPINQLPMYVAVGFVTGHVIAIPLLTGFFAKFLCIDPLFNAYKAAWPTITITSMDFTLAFCSGMVLYGTVMSLIEFPAFIKKGFSYLYLYTNTVQNNGQAALKNIDKGAFAKVAFILMINVLFLSYFTFPWLAQLFLLAFSAVCVYQMLIVAGVMGIVPLGRFATFVMVPSMLLFKLDVVQITLTAAFVEIAGGVAGDALFGRKMALLGNIKHRSIVFYQWLGLIISSLCIGIIFWLFITHLGLGIDSGLPVTKAASRALLINFQSFDPFVLVAGFIFGYMITFIKINPALLLGGILMPPSISFMLIIGGLCTFLTKKSERYYPLFSGISAGNSLWMLIEMFLK